MYQTLITKRYLSSKIMPILAMLAVMLSVATVLVTWSVMGGFLDTLLKSGRKLMGDVRIYWPNVGFAHYEDLIERLEGAPEIEAATPVIETLGMVTLPDGRVATLQVRGVEPAGFDRVTGYFGMLWWRPAGTGNAETRPNELKAVAGVLRSGGRLEVEEQRLVPELQESLGIYLRNGERMEREDATTGVLGPAAVVGIEVNQWNERTDAGWYYPESTVVRATGSGAIGFSSGFLPAAGRLQMTLVQLDAQGTPIDAVRSSLPVANEYYSGIYDTDSSSVLVPFEWLQRKLGMQEARRLSEDAEVFGAVPELSEATEVDPGRSTSVLVLGKEGTTPEAVKAACERVYRAFARAHAGEVPADGLIVIRTFEDEYATLIGAIRNETGIVLVVFAIVCVTVVFLVLSIFWSMISEKTKDIGVLRSLGASRAGVAGLWLSYGLGLGVVGAGLGTVAAVLIVTNINAVHDAIKALTGAPIWDPSVYYFATIPAEMEPEKAVLVAVAGVVTAVFGAAVPAVRAAMMDPVRALRFE